MRDAKYKGTGSCFPLIHNKNQPHSSRKTEAQD